MGFQTVLCQFLFDDRVIVPEDESVVRCLVLRNTEFGIDVVLHTMVVSVQMVRSDIHQYGDIGTEVIHIVQLERAEFDDIIVMMLFGYLQSQALADISGQSYIQICTLKDVVDQGSSRCLSVGTGDTDHFCIGIASGKLDFGDNRCTLGFQFQDQRGVIRDTGAFNHLIGIQNEFFGMMSFLPGNMVAVQKVLILILDSGHIRNKCFKSFYFGEYGCTSAAFTGS